MNSPNNSASLGAQSANYRWQVFVAGLISTLAYAYLALNSQSYGDLSLTQFYCAVLLAGAACVLLWWCLQATEQQISVRDLLLFALLFRLLGVYAFPILEDDIYRFLWDGRMTIEHGSPYGVAPADYFNDESLSARFEHILDRINYPEVATVYAPVNQWLFAISYLLAPGETWPLQLIYALIDMCVILVLLQLAKPNWVLLYAWSPLVIKEFAFTAHPDVLGALCCLSAFWAYRVRRYNITAVLLALALGVKIFALLLVPLLLGWQWRAWLVFFISLLLIGLPWGLRESWLPDGLAVMSNDWLFNAPIYLLLQPWLTFSQSKLLLLGCLALFCVGYYVHCMRHWPNPNIRGDVLFALLFVCSPVLNPWYWVWLLPFAVLYPSLWAWVASFALLLAYCSGINLPDPNLEAYQIPNYIIAIEFALIGCCVLYSWLIKKAKPLQKQ